MVTVLAIANTILVRATVEGMELSHVNYHTPPKGGMWLSLNGLPD